MKLLILGGTKFLGRHLVEAGLASGHEVTIFNRGLHNPGLFPEVEELHGDRRVDLSALAGRRWDAVIDTCGFVPSAVHASARLLSEAVEHYTFISSQSVYADFKTHALNENHPVMQLTDEQVQEAEAIKPEGATTAINYGEAYGGLKALCERAVEEEMPGRTLSIRAGLIVGPHDYSDRYTYWVRRVALGGEVLAPAEPTRPVQVVDARDLSEWLVRMAETRQTGVFNATGPDYRMTMGEMLEACKEASESDANFTWVDDQFLTDEGVAGWSEMPLWLQAEHDIENFMSVDCSKAFKAGLTFRPMTETARATLEWDRTRDAGQELKAGLKREREKELLEAWHAKK